LCDVDNINDVIQGCYDSYKTQFTNTNGFCIRTEHSRGFSKNPLGNCALDDTYSNSLKRLDKNSNSEHIADHCVRGKEFSWIDTTDGNCQISCPSPSSPTDR
jgi:hypothetical protein